MGRPRIHDTPPTKVNLTFDAQTAARLDAFIVEMRAKVPGARFTRVDAVRALVMQALGRAA